MNHVEIEKRLNEAIDSLNSEGIIKESSDKVFNRLQKISVLENSILRGVIISEQMKVINEKLYKQQMKKVKMDKT